MGKRIQERRGDRIGADDVAALEEELWAFAKRPDPPTVQDARLRPGAYLYRLHRVWHSLGRGAGIASHSFRALRDELLKRDPPVRNLQPKLYGTSPVSQADASTLIDVMLETWHVAHNNKGEWEVSALTKQQEPKTVPADDHDIDAIRENLLHTLFRGEDALLLEEPVGVPPEMFLEERGRSSLAFITPTKGEIVAQLSPSNLYGGFSAVNARFLDAAIKRRAEGKSVPLLIWVLRLDAIRDNAEFHQSFHALAVYSACLTNWYLRLSRRQDLPLNQDYWGMLVSQCAFAVYGLPSWTVKSNSERAHSKNAKIDRDLIDLGPEFMVPYQLPIVLSSHRQVKKYRNFDFSLAVSVESIQGTHQVSDFNLNYWLFPDRPKMPLEETADTTGLPIFDAEMSPGQDFDLAYAAIYEAVTYHLGFSKTEKANQSLNTLRAMGWHILTIQEFQSCLMVSKSLGVRRAGH